MPFPPTGPTTAPSTRPRASLSHWSRRPPGDAAEPSSPPAHRSCPTLPTLGPVPKPDPGDPWPPSAGPLASRPAPAAPRPPAPPPYHMYARPLRFQRSLAGPAAEVPVRARARRPSRNPSIDSARRLSSAAVSGVEIPLLAGDMPVAARPPPSFTLSALFQQLIAEASATAADQPPPRPAAPRRSVADRRSSVAPR
eukprot:EG_transcript_20198